MWLLGQCTAMKLKLCNRSFITDALSARSGWLDRVFCNSTELVTGNFKAVIESETTRNVFDRFVAGCFES